MSRDAATDSFQLCLMVDSPNIYEKMQGGIKISCWQWMRLRSHARDSCVVDIGFEVGLGAQERSFCLER